MLILKELEFTNFKSWKKLHLRDLDKKGLFLIQGKNGCGKSSIRQGFEYLILDKTSDDLSVDELPRNQTEECTLRGVIQKDEDIIEITKYRNHKKNDNKTILSINGNDDLTHTDRRITQKKIEEVLGIKEDAVLISTIFSSESPSFPKAKDSERKSIVYDALDLHKYEGYSKEAGNKCNDIKEGLSEISIKKENLEEKIIALAYELEDLKTIRDDFKNISLNKVAKLLLEKDEIIEEDTSSLCKQIEDLEQSIGDVDDVTYNSLIAKVDELTTSEIKLKETIKSIDRDVERVDRDIKKVESGTCPVFHDECARLVERSESAVSKLSPEKEKLLTEKEKLSKKLNNVENKIKDVKVEVKTTDKIIESNERIRKEIDKSKTDLKLIEKDNENLKEKIANIEKQIKEISKEENPYVKLVKEKEDKLKIEKNKKQEFEDKTKKLQDNLKYYEYWKEGYSKAGIPSLKSDGFLEEVESSINRYLSSIGDKMFVEISAQSKLKSKDIREKIGYKILHPEKSITDFSSYSGGEKQRVKVANIFSFFDLIGKFNIMVLDEVLEQSLDEVGIEGVIDLLTTKIQDDNIGTIMVISHNNKIKQHFDNVLHITKTNGVSKIDN